jgi:hypothetical protein
LIAALLLACFAAPLAIAQSGADVAAEPCVPRLGDIMNTLQLRHLKLYFAGRAQNWELADFELHRLREGLSEAALLYSGIPATNVTTLATPIRSIAEAIKAKNVRKFTDALGQFTDGCNACHQTMGRKFIVIGLPTEQPFTNQVFAPQGRK